MAKRLFVHNGKTYKCRRPNAVRMSHEDTDALARQLMAGDSTFSTSGDTIVVHTGDTIVVGTIREEIDLEEWA